jgi:hypothetical protein
VSRRDLILLQVVRPRTFMPETGLVSYELFWGPYWDDQAGWLQVAWEHEMAHAAQIRSWRVTKVKALAQEV